MKVKQKTIQNSVSLKGIGLHMGCDVEITLMPAEINTGIQFKRIDLENKPVIKADPKNVKVDTSVPRCTSISSGDVTIHTVEHLMSALCGAEITNIIIEIDNIELPGMDGSANDFFQAIKTAGIVEQDATIEAYEVIEPIGVELKGCSIFILPSKKYCVSYTLDYTDSYFKSQFFSLEITPESYEKEIASCRTFCLESEAKELQSLGLGKGANHTNTLVMGEEGVIDNELRFEDECARHKILDFIGDLYLLGGPIRGHVYAIKSGHTLNSLLLKKILMQKEKVEAKGIVPCFSLEGKKEIGIEDIMKILPHRYPFLLVDRVVEIEHGKKAVGIKNVTINDGFFQGHFPTRPIMPGVLMVEAMAQTAGVVVLTNEAHHGKVAFFMAVDNVKFRRPVVPGDQLLMEVEVVRDRSRTTQVHAKAVVGDELVAQADMVFSFTDISYLD